MTQVRPALVVEGGTRRLHAVLAVIVGVTGLWALGSLAILVRDLATGADGRTEWRQSEMPLWVLMTISVLVSGSAAWRTFTYVRQTGPHHGLLDMAVVDGALRVSKLRTWLRPLSVVVRPGETVTVRARAELPVRDGAGSLVWFWVIAPAGSFTFAEAVNIDKFSLAPLDDAARELGIKVEVSGDATAMGRSAHL